MLAPATPHSHTHSLTHEYLSITTSLPHYITALSDCDTDPQQSRSSPVELCVSSAAVHRRPASRQPCHRYPHSLTHSLTHYSLTHFLSQVSAKPKVTIESFFAKSSTPTPSRTAEAKSAPTVTTTDSAVHSSSSKNHTHTHTHTNTQAGSTPTISKALFVSKNTSISAKKDSAQLKAHQGKDIALAHSSSSSSGSGRSRLPPRAHIITIKSDNNTPEGT